MLRSALVTLTLLAAPFTTRAQDSAGQPVSRRERVAAVVDSIAREAIGRKVLAGMVVIAVHRSDTFLARGYGLADLENDVRMTAAHVFQLASVTKQLTAAAVLTLVGDGRVALDAPITRYLPDAPVQGRTITVRQLLAHTSGLSDYAESPRIPALKRLDLPPDSLLALIATTPPYFEPGEQMRYSNTGFALLGRLIERLSGQPYATYVEQRVLRPAGATRAHFCDPEALVRHLARGYSATPGGLRPAAFISPHLPYAAGGFCGTAGDLAAWNAALHARRGGQVLAPALYAEMVAPGMVAGGRRTRYGLGVALSDLAGHPAVHHGGDIDGFTTFTAYLPDDSLNLTVLINTQGPTRPDAVAAAVVEAALGPRRQRPAGRGPGDLTMFAGRYGDDVTVSPMGKGSGGLRLTRGPLPPAELRYAGRSGTGWTFTDGHARYTFEPPGPGASRSLAVWADLVVALVRWERAR
jgi:CubicO group peptidase (beta-lactamase class C family)